MKVIQQLLSKKITHTSDEAILLEEIKKQLNQGNVQSSEVMDYLKSLKSRHVISDSLLQSIYTLIDNSNASTVLSSSSINASDQTKLPLNEHLGGVLQKNSTLGFTNQDKTKIAAQSDIPLDLTAISDSENITPATNSETRISTVGTQREETQKTGTSQFNEDKKKLKSGSILKDRFILKDILGSGGMSVVFRALDLRKQEAKNSNPYVAIKVLGDSFREHPLSLLALERETQKIQSLAHPNIVTVYDFDRDGENIYMTMECLEGHSLDELIRKNKNGIPFEQARPIIEDMCRALIYAHSKNIIHSDFKPENVFHLNNSVTKVLDFGIARAKKPAGRKAVDTVFDAGSLSALTPPYASLEMLLDMDPDPRDDIYALGCVIYKLLTGKHPFNNLQADQALTAKLQPEKIKNLDRKQWHTLLHCLAFEREERIETVEDFLEGIIPKKRPVWIYVAIVCVFIAIGLSGYLGTNISKQNRFPEIKLTVEQTSKIKNHLEIADLYFSLGYLATPPGDSALDQYEKILAINPANQEAIAGKKKIVTEYNNLALKKLKLNALEDGLQLTETGLLIEPDNEDLLDTQRKIIEQQAQFR